MSAHLTMIAGLGNPEDRYARTLHNAGFWFADEMARRAGASFKYEKRFDAEICRAQIGSEEVWLAKPQSYMNNSGGPIRALLDYYRLNIGQLLVAHDDLDLPPGAARLKVGGGHGGHNGLRDIMQHAGNDFMRLRLGIGHPGDKSQVTAYVLKRGTAEVEAAVEQAVGEAADVMSLLLEQGLEKAMNRLHTSGSSD
ncbi:MAG TPA: aminoacyl-tRNA hydrolase [Woeseiaceae bacterium]